MDNTMIQSTELQNLKQELKHEVSTVRRLRDKQEISELRIIALRDSIQVLNEAEDG